MADAVNNLSDAGSSIVTLIGFKLAGKPADYEHPYGHGRIEYISGFIVSGAIIIMGFELMTTSFRKILHPTPLEVSVPSIIILVLSILMKMWMAKFNKYLGNKVDSAAMKRNGYRQPVRLRCNISSPYRSASYPVFGY